jgi:hypothetical protein
LEHLCVVDLQEAHYDAVQQTVARIHEMVQIAPTFYSRAIEYELRVHLAFETQSLDVLAQFKVPSDALEPFRHAARSQLNVAAVELGDCVMRGSDAEVEAALAAINRLQPAFRGRCDQDFVTAVMTAALRRLGRHAEATHLLSDYLQNSRREPYYLLPSLVRLASEAGIKTNRFASQIAQTQLTFS